MLRFYAERYIDLVRSLKGVEVICGTPAPAGENFYLSEDILPTLNNLLDNALSACSDINLGTSAILIRRLRANMDHWQTTKYEDFGRHIEEVQMRIHDEMSTNIYMRLPVERAQRYEQDFAFGMEVATNFPNATFDISEAGNCYATARYTACVFHLMRALEVTLSAFADIFNVPSDHTNWHNIIEGIESKVRGMGNDPNKLPDWKNKQEFYAQAANSFMFFKDAWRNYTAHARGKYTEDEADAIFRNVRAFMQKLAHGGIQEGAPTP